mmetsp:Transcript_42075/g.77879  ORF Transcript_42075/g.77879 Transcript_42075/m.77879 type:complete len:91 (+) Transcript_42075:454-726(+)
MVQSSLWSSTKIFPLNMCHTPLKKQSKHPSNLSSDESASWCLAPSVALQQRGTQNIAPSMTPEQYLRSDVLCVFLEPKLSIPRNPLYNNH